MPKLRCPSCGHVYMVPAAPLGAAARCPYCQAVSPITAGMQVPEGPEAAAPGPRPRMQAPPPPGRPRPANASPHAPGHPGRHAIPAQRSNGGKQALILGGVLVVVIGIVVVVAVSQGPSVPVEVPLPPRPAPTAMAVAPPAGAGGAPARLPVATQPAGRADAPAPAQTFPLEFVAGTTDMDRRTDPSDETFGYLVGSVRNVGTLTMRRVGVAMHLVNKDGQVISGPGIGISQGEIAWLLPGQTARFMITWRGVPPELVAGHRLVFLPPTYADGKFEALTVNSPTYEFTDSDTGWQGAVTGVVVNSSGVAVRDATVLALVCDTEGRILKQLDGGPIEGRTMSPRASSRFKLPYDGSTNEPQFNNSGLEDRKLEVRAFGKVQ